MKAYWMPFYGSSLCILFSREKTRQKMVIIDIGPILLLRSWIGSSAFWTGFRVKGYWSCTSPFSSKIIRHIIMYIHDKGNLIHANRLMIPGKKSLTGSFNQKWSRFRIKLFYDPPLNKSRPLCTDDKAFKRMTFFLFIKYHLNFNGSGVAPLVKL